MAEASSPHNSPGSLRFSAPIKPPASPRPLVRLGTASNLRPKVPLRKQSLTSVESVEQNLANATVQIQAIEKEIQEQLHGGDIEEDSIVTLASMNSMLCSMRAHLTTLHSTSGGDSAALSATAERYRDFMHASVQALAPIAGPVIQTDAGSLDARLKRRASGIPAPELSGGKPAAAVRASVAKQMLIKIVAEEGNYVNMLESIVNSYMPAVVQDGTATPAETKTLFSQCKELLDLHTGMMLELKESLKRWPDSGVGNVILERLPQFNIYQQYFLNAAESASILQRLSLEKSFANVIKQYERKEGSLASLLQRPLRRVEEIVFSLDGFYKNLPPASNERNSVEECRDTLQDLLDTVEQRESVAGNLEKVMEIGMSIDGLEENLVRPDRRFIFEGHFKLTIGGTRKTVADYAFLFNDVLLYCQSSGKGYTYVGRIYMHLVAMDDQESNKNAFSLACGDEKFNVVTSEKSDWLLYLGKVLREVERTRKVFGVPLRVLMKREKDSDIPAIVEKAINFIYDYGLQKEGIFRQTGRSTQINKLKDQLNQGAKVFFSENMDVHSVAVLFKVWLRELPEPLLTWAGYSDFMGAMALPSEEEQVSAISAAVYALPRPNKFVLQHLLKCLQTVCANEAKTKMNPANLSVVFAPNILKSVDEDTMPFDATVFERTNDCFKVMLQHYDWIFAIVEEERASKLEDMLKQQEEDRVSLKHSRRLRSGAAKDDGQKVLEGCLFALEKKKWSQRWFVLKYNSLQLFKSAKADKKLKQTLPLKGVQVSTAPTSTRAFSICLQIPLSPDMLLAARSSDEQEEWIKALRNCVP